MPSLSSSWRYLGPFAHAGPSELGADPLAAIAGGIHAAAADDDAFELYSELVGAPVRFAPVAARLEKKGAAAALVVQHGRGVGRFQGWLVGELRAKAGDCVSVEVRGQADPLARVGVVGVHLLPARRLRWCRCLLCATGRSRIYSA